MLVEIVFVSSSVGAMLKWTKYFVAMYIKTASKLIVTRRNSLDSWHDTQYLNLMLDNLIWNMYVHTNTNVINILKLYFESTLTTILNILSVCRCLANWFNDCSSALQNWKLNVTKTIVNKLWFSMDASTSTVNYR